MRHADAARPGDCKQSHGNLRPVDVYQGRAEDILCDCEAVAGRKELKRQTLRARREYDLGVSHQQERSAQTGSEVDLISSPAASGRVRGGEQGGPT